MISALRFSSVFATLLLVTTSMRSTEMPAPMPPAAAPIETAIAVIIPTMGNSVTGVVRFTQTAGGVHVVADVVWLKQGAHGFHIHEFGDISSTDGLSTGGHFNPSHSLHGAPASPDRHAGDMGNLNADANGHATLDYMDTIISLSGTDSIIGRSVVVHADADDLKSQPTGKAGKRLATGVIGVGK